MSVKPDFFVSAEVNVGVVPGVSGGFIVAGKENFITLKIVTTAGTWNGTNEEELGFSFVNNDVASIWTNTTFLDSLTFEETTGVISLSVTPTEQSEFLYITDLDFTVTSSSETFRVPVKTTVLHSTADPSKLSVYLNVDTFNSGKSTFCNLIVENNVDAIDLNDGSYSIHYGNMLDKTERWLLPTTTIGATEVPSTEEEAYLVVTIKNTAGELITACAYQDPALPVKPVAVDTTLPDWLNHVEYRMGRNVTFNDSAFYITSTSVAEQPNYTQFKITVPDKGILSYNEFNELFFIDSGDLKYPTRDIRGDLEVVNVTNIAGYPGIKNNLPTILTGEPTFGKLTLVNKSTLERYSTPEIKTTVHATYASLSGYFITLPIVPVVGQPVRIIFNKTSSYKRIAGNISYFKINNNIYTGITSYNSSDAIRVYQLESCPDVLRIRFYLSTSNKYNKNIQEVTIYPRVTPASLANLDNVNFRLHPESRPLSLSSIISDIPKHDTLSLSAATLDNSLKKFCIPPGVGLSRLPLIIPETPLPEEANITLSGLYTGTYPVDTTVPMPATQVSNFNIVSSRPDLLNNEVTWTIPELPSVSTLDNPYTVEWQIPGETLTTTTNSIVCTVTRIPTAISATVKFNPHVLPTPFNPYANEKVVAESELFTRVSIYKDNYQPLNIKFTGCQSERLANYLVEYDNPSAGNKGVMYYFTQQSVNDDTLKPTAYNFDVDNTTVSLKSSDLPLNTTLSRVIISYRDSAGDKIVKVDRSLWHPMNSDVNNVIVTLPEVTDKFPTVYKKTDGLKTPIKIKSDFVADLELLRFNGNVGYVTSVDSTVLDYEQLYRGGDYGNYNVRTSSTFSNYLQIGTFFQGIPQAKPGNVTGYAKVIVSEGDAIKGRLPELKQLVLNTPFKISLDTDLEEYTSVALNHVVDLDGTAVTELTTNDVMLNTEYQPNIIVTIGDDIVPVRAFNSIATGINFKGVVEDVPIVISNAWSEDKRYPGEPLDLVIKTSSPSGIDLVAKIHAMTNAWPEGLNAIALTPIAFHTDKDLSFPMTTSITEVKDIPARGVIIHGRTYTSSVFVYNTVLPIGARRITTASIYSFEAFLDEGVKTVRCNCIRADYTTEHLVTLVYADGEFSGYLRDLGNAYFLSFDITDDTFYDLMISTDNGVGFTFDATAEYSGTNIANFVTKVVDGKSYLGFSTGSNINTTRVNPMHREEFGYCSRLNNPLDGNLYSTTFNLLSMAIESTDPNTLVVTWDYNLLGKVGSTVTFAANGLTAVSATLFADGERVVAKFVAATELCDLIRLNDGIDLPISLVPNLTETLTFGKVLINTALTPAIDVALNEVPARVFYNTDAALGEVIGITKGDVSVPKITTIGMTDKVFIRAETVVPGDRITITPVFSTFLDTVTTNDHVTKEATFLIDNDKIGWLEADAEQAVVDNWTAWVTASCSADIDIDNTINGFDIVKTDKVVYSGNVRVQSAYNSALKAYGYRDIAGSKFGSIDNAVIEGVPVFHHLSGRAIVPLNVLGVYSKIDNLLTLELSGGLPGTDGMSFNVINTQGTYNTGPIVDVLSDATNFTSELPAPAGYDLVGTVPGSYFGMDLAVNEFGKYNDYNVVLTLNYYSTDSIMSKAQSMKADIQELFAPTSTSTFTPYAVPDDSYFGLRLQVPSVSLQGWRATINGKPSSLQTVQIGERDMKFPVSKTLHEELLVSKYPYVYMNIEQVFSAMNGLTVGRVIEDNLVYSGFSVDKGIGDLFTKTMFIDGNFEVDVTILGLYVLEDKTAGTISCYLELNTDGISALGRTLTVTTKDDTVLASGIVVEGTSDDGRLTVSLTGSTGFNDNILAKVNSEEIIPVDYILTESVVTNGSDALVSFKDIPVPTGNAVAYLQSTIDRSVLPADGDSSWFNGFRYNQKDPSLGEVLYVSVLNTVTSGSEIRVTVTDIIDNSTIELIDFNTVLNTSNGGTKAGTILPDNYYYQNGVRVKGRVVIDAILNMLGERVLLDVVLTEPSYAVGDYNITVDFFMAGSIYGYRKGVYGDLDNKVIAGEVNNFQATNGTDLSITGIEFYGDEKMVLSVDATAVEHIGRTLTYHLLNEETTFDAVFAYNEVSGNIEATFGPELASVYTRMYTGYKLGFGLSVSGVTTTTYIGNVLVKTSSEVIEGKYIARNGTIHPEGDFIIANKKPV